MASVARQSPNTVESIERDCFGLRPSQYKGKMSNFLYSIRNYQPVDFEQYVQLNIEAEKLEPTGRHISRQVIAERLGQPNYSPEQDLFIVELAGNIVGYMDVIAELTIGRVILNCWIHPKHRRQGLSGRLLNGAMQCARELGAKVAHVNIAEDNAVARSVLSRLGFECVRRFLELRLDMARVQDRDIEQAALACCHLQPGEEDRLTQLQNSAFAGTWGYNPNTVEEIVYRTSLSDCSPEDIVLAYDGDRVAGYCWSGVVCEGETATDERPGRIFMLGVTPDYRGKGIGRSVLLAGLAHLKSKGLRVAELTVDSGNKTACALYWSIGFEVWKDSLWYEKAVNQATEAR